jgi:hypothetical protein
MNQIEGSQNPNVRLMRSLVGFFFAVGLILIEMGIAELVLRRNIECIVYAESGILALNPDEVCLPEGVRYFVTVLTHGPLSISQSNPNLIMAWSINLLLYGIVGGILAQFPPRSAISIFLIIHILAVAALTMLTFLLAFIV